MDREHRIRQRAHEIWEQAGHPHGREHEHWDQACREIGEQADMPSPEVVTGEADLPAKKAKATKSGAKVAATDGETAKASAKTSKPAKKPKAPASTATQVEAASAAKPKRTVKKAGA